MYLLTSHVYISVILTTPILSLQLITTSSTTTTATAHTSRQPLDLDQWA